MNFAHHELFVAYANAMFAQDEIQVAEHPALASVREALLARDDRLRPATVERDAPTPVLVRGAARALAIDTRRIYGWRFADAGEQTVRDSVTVLDPPAPSNILAIEAPVPVGHAVYTRGEITAALQTAFAGFRAVVLHASCRDTPLAPVVHTGNWGCGAYGGNPELMLTLQLLAARLAGLARIVFFCGGDDPRLVTDYDRALATRFRLRPGVPVGRVVDRLVAAGYRWGTPDGN